MGFLDTFGSCMDRVKTWEVEDRTRVLFGMGISRGACAFRLALLVCVVRRDAIVNVVRIPRGQVWAMRGRCALLAAIGSAPQSLLDP